MNRALVDQARERIVLADRSRLGQVARRLICPTSGVHMLITDREATGRQSDSASIGANVVVAVKTRARAEEER